MIVMIPNFQIMNYDNLTGSLGALILGNCIVRIDKKLEAILDTILFSVQEEVDRSLSCMLHAAVSCMHMYVRTCMEPYSWQLPVE